MAELAAGKMPVVYPLWLLRSRPRFFAEQQTNLIQEKRQPATMTILVLNCGSSSLKYKLFAAEGLALLAAGMAERIGQADSRLHNRWHRADGDFAQQEHHGVTADHRAALQHVFRDLAEEGVLRDSADVTAVGHRVVHGGERFREPALLDAAAIAAIRELVPLAPLHNPANLLGIELAQALCPRAAQVAVFDTAFHQTLPPHAFRYALPEWTYRQHQVRRYGFHGTSVAYVGRRAAELLGRSFEQLNLIVLHLGNGASVTAIRNGQSVDTSMGMTPLEGLIMGTRCGDLDPDVPFYLMRHTQLSADQTEDLLFHNSGLRGLAGVGDMRELQALAQQGDDAAELALQMTSYRLKKYIGAYSAALGRVDAVVFTAGIGENDPGMRARACSELNNLGIVLDHELNAIPAAAARDVAAAGSAVRILVIPTDEEWEIARATLACLKS